MASPLETGVLVLGMKTLYKKASHLRAHTWRDIGGLGGIILDGMFFAFLFVVSGIVLAAGAMVVVLDYLFSPLLALASMSRSRRIQHRDTAVLQEDGTLRDEPTEAPNKSMAEDILYPL